FRVSSAMEPVTEVLEFGTQLQEVVDLAVVDHVVATARAAHRLRGRGCRVEDREATMGECQATLVGRHRGLPVRSPVRERRNETADGRGLDHPAIAIPDAGDSAHDCRLRY